MIQPNPRIAGELFPDAESYALRLPSGRGQVIAVWYDIGTFDMIGNYVNRMFSLADYVIEVNPSPEDALPVTGWEIVLSVTDNRFSTRQHLIDLDGCRWVRIRFLRFGGKPYFRFDIHDAPDGISDSWLFLGDSITACAMGNAWGTSFAERLHALDDRFFPVQQNGGIGGLNSRDGRTHVRAWLAGNPARFVPVAFGTNDAWGQPNDLQAYEQNIRYMLDAVLEAGKIPVLPTIPYAADPHAGRCTAQYNDVIHRIYADRSTLLHGPDLYTFFRTHPQYLSTDGVHPSEDGYEAMRRLWAETMYTQLYK